MLSALSNAPPVQLSSSQAIVPIKHLQEALKTFLIGAIRQAAISDLVSPMYQITHTHWIAFSILNES